MVLAGPVGPEIDHPGRREFTFLAGQVVLARLVDLAGRGVEGQPDLLAGLVSGGLDGAEDELAGFLVALPQDRGESAFVADRRGVPLFLEDALEGLEDLARHPQALAETRRANRHDHEFLQVDRKVGVGAAVHDVAHRHGQHTGRRAADVLVERQVGLGGGGLGDRQTDAQDGVGAEFALVGGAVQGDHRFIDAHLVAGVHADDLRRDEHIDVLDGLRDALAEVAPAVAVPEFDGLMFARRSAAGDGGTAEGAAFEFNVHFQRRRAARVQGFAGVDTVDRVRHGFGDSFSLSPTAGEEALSPPGPFGRASRHLYHDGRPVATGLWPRLREAPLSGAVVVPT